MDYRVVDEASFVVAGDSRRGGANEILGPTAPSCLSMEDFAHELRQPLSVIETLAYHLEIASGEERTRAHAQRIQAMICRANQILERMCSC